MSNQNLLTIATKNYPNSISKDKIKYTLEELKVKIKEIEGSFETKE